MGLSVQTAFNVRVGPGPQSEPVATTEEEIQFNQMMKEQLKNTNAMDVELDQESNLKPTSR
jgi:hypothetical protein